MERDTDDRPLADATGMERPDDLPAMEAGDDESRREEATGDEKTALEGASGIAATHRAFGGGAINAAGGIGTDVPTDEDEHMDAGVDESKDSTDPRGY
ncbi:MAG TPA: hypothetical protein VJ975_05610 [Candidatus Limnocylindria bacterium]|nr:hypothetical protein [Candidatus Limnocylindria bacterium]